MMQQDHGLEPRGLRHAAAGVLALPLQAALATCQHTAPQGDAPGTAGGTTTGPALVDVSAEPKPTASPCPKGVPDTMQCLTGKDSVGAFYMGPPRLRLSPGPTRGLPGLVQVFTSDHEHSYLTDADDVAAMGALLDRVEHGRKPTPQSVAQRCQVEAASDCSFLSHYRPAPLSSRSPERGRQNKPRWLFTRAIFIKYGVLAFHILDR